MNADDPTMLSLIAAAIYATVVLMCLAAAVVAASKRQISGHVVLWGAIAVFFACLVFLRINNLEDIWREELRAMMRADGYYADRRAFQGPVAAGIMTLVALGAWFWIVRVHRSAQGRRNVVVAVAQLGVLLMVCTMALRLVSLSLIDKFLYGPLKLNWVGDMGSAVLVAGCAAYYIVVVIASPRRGRPKKPS